MHSRTGALFLLAAFIAAPAFAQQRMYKCVDAKGRVYYTQIPPQECLGRATDELSKSGRVMNRNEPTPTPAQQAAREAARKKKLEDDANSKDERRKNMALLNTYSSENDIDEARARALKDAEAAIRAAENRIADANKRRKELDTEREFYANKKPPAKLVQEVKINENDVNANTALLDAKKKQISVINAKYDEDKRKYLELTRPPAAASAKAKK
jgi:hypothetical protein